MMTRCAARHWGHRITSQGRLWEFSMTWFVANIGISLEWLDLLYCQPQWLGSCSRLACHLYLSLTPTSADFTRQFGEQKQRKIIRRKEKEKKTVIRRYSRESILGWKKLKCQQIRQQLKLEKMIHISRLQWRGCALTSPDDSQHGGVYTWANCPREYLEYLNGGVLNLASPWLSHRPPTPPNTSTFQPETIDPLCPSAVLPRTSTHMHAHTSQVP